MKPTLKLSNETWHSLSPDQQQEQRDKFCVVVQQPYAQAPDHEQLREMAPVAKEVNHG